MTVMLGRYSGFSPEIFERAIVPRMRDSDLRLYLFLCRASDRKSSRQFTATDKEIREQSGASPRALRDARINLTAFGLISCKKFPGGSYTYALCDPDTGQPYPGDPKVKAPYVKRGNVRRNQGAEGEKPRSVPLPPAKLFVTDSSFSEDTSFDFGHNEKTKKASISAEDVNPFERSYSRR
jgi:hypothetical protein